jgi:opacity protein-like surface antigen
MRNTTLKAIMFAGAILVASGVAVCQTTNTSVSAMSPAVTYGKFETAPGFMYIHTAKTFGLQNGLNCVGGGGTLAYNFSALVGFAADLGGCKIVGLNNALGQASLLTGKEFTFLFGPRITFRSKSPFQPFGELSLGGTRASISCNVGDFGNDCGALGANLPINIPTATSFSKSAFSLSVGGGADIKINQKFAIRLVQAEYLYTRFGNNCQFAICSANNNQNSFRLKSGVVMSWGIKSK